MNYFFRVSFSPFKIHWRHFCGRESSFINANSSKILSKVVENLEKDGRKIILNIDDARKSVIPVLLKYGFKDDEICTFMCSNINFLSISGKKLSPILETFVRFGVSVDSALMALALEPVLLEVDEELITDQLTILKDIISNRKTLSNFIENNADKILRPLKPLLQSKNDLKSFFATEQVGYMINRSPELLLRKFEDLEKIYEYIYYVMGLEPMHIYKTNWFKYTLAEIRVRHEFAIQAGVYKRPHPKRPAVAAENPDFKDIIDTDDKQFAKLCGVTLNELNMFQEMYAEKMEDEDEVDAAIAKQKRYNRPLRGKRDTSYNEIDESEAYDDDSIDNEDEDEQGHAKTDDKPDRVIKKWLNPRQSRDH